MNTNTTIILGTAHLSSTPGKRSPDGSFREYRYSREICKVVQESLQRRGYKCIIDYVGDDMPSVNSSQELVNRVKVVNQYCNSHPNENCIYCSIHVNAAANSGWSNATGWSIYTTPGVTKSDTLAECIYQVAAKVLRPLGKKIRVDMSDGDHDYEENFYVLRKTVCPAVLTENFFQDNKSDIQWLQSEEGKQAIVNIHVEGIENYVRSFNKS